MQTATKDVDTETENEPLEGRAKIIAIRECISALDPKNPNHWTKDGKPDCNVLMHTLKTTVTSAERDEIWAAMQGGDANADPKQHDPVVNGDVPLHAARPEPWQGKWAVYDTLARREPRVHYPLGLDGVKVTLKADSPAPMPMAIAVKFLCDPAFKVFNAFGDPVLSLPDQEIVTAGKFTTMDLKLNEVVAKLGELTLESLLVRVNRLPGGEQFGEDSRREAIEDFYINTRQALRQAHPDDKSDDKWAELPDDKVSHLLEGV